MNADSQKRSTDQRKRSKKIIIAVFSCVIGFILLYYAISGIASRIDGKEPEETKRPSYIFYPADFDENIMEDNAYLDLDRSIYYSDPSTGLTSTSQDDVPSMYRNYAFVIAEYLRYGIEGNNVALNSLFSSDYYENGGKNKEEFTMQRLYEMKITYMGIPEENEDAFLFKVDYKIQKNNGTFRNDMGSDCTKSEYFTLSQHEENILIDSIVVFTYQ